jgi:LmbE family N-acetylglucosaminyl deacetylase
MTVLAVFAHPDDEVLAAGATLARYAREGCTVHIAILGDGVTSQSASREQALDLPETSNSARLIISVDVLRFAVQRLLAREG